MHNVLQYIKSISKETSSLYLSFVIISIRMSDEYSSLNQSNKAILYIIIIRFETDKINK